MRQVLRIVHCTKDFASDLQAKSARETWDQLVVQLSSPTTEDRPSDLPSAVDWPGMTMEKEHEILAWVMPEDVGFDFESGSFLDRSRRSHVLIPDQVATFQIKLNAHGDAQLTNRYHYFDGLPDQPNPEADPSELGLMLSQLRRLRRYVDEAVHSSRGLIAHLVPGN